MNMGFILFLSSLLLGTPSNKETAQQQAIKLTGEDLDKDSLTFYITSLPKYGKLKDGDNEITLSADKPYKVQGSLFYTHSSLTSSIGSEEDTTKDKPYGHPDNKVTKDKKTIFGTIYPNTFYLDCVKTDSYCLFAKIITFQSFIPIKQKVYYVFYKEGGTNIYPFSNTIYQDLAELDSGEQAIKSWENIKSNKIGARCSKEPLKH